MGNPAPTPPPFHLVPSWEHAAACRDGDPEIFFPEGDQAAADEARAVCASCPVRTPCLREGVREPYGVRAGLDADERDPLARAHSVYRHEVARLDATLRAAGDTAGLRAAWTALAAEGDAVAGLALAIAAGATPAEIETAAQVATAAAAEAGVLLAELGVVHPARLQRAGGALLAAAVDIASPPTTELVSAGLAVAS